MIDYKAQMDDRLARMDELFRRAEAFEFEMAKLREAYGLTQDDSFHELPAETKYEAAEAVRDSYDAVETTIQETQDAYEDINIDDIIASMDLGIQL